MNRETKFRVWNKLDKKFIPNYSVWLRFDKRYPCCVQYTTKEVDTIGDDNYLESSQCVIQQYTGVKDKNNVEIYEGDIVQTNWSENDDLICKVVYWKNGFYFEYKNNSLIGDTIYQFQYCEIIGNIFENTDLLKL
jgi:uncharacterized phage protein (TIGR01671 family)